MTLSCKSMVLLLTLPYVASALRATAPIVAPLEAFGKSAYNLTGLNSSELSFKGGVMRYNGKPLIGAIASFRCELCSTRCADKGTYKKCFDFMTTMCVPGADGLMNDSPGEMTTGMGFCSNFFNTGCGGNAKVDAAPHVVAAAKAAVAQHYDPPGPPHPLDNHIVSNHVKYHKLNNHNAAGRLVKKKGPIDVADECRQVCADGQIGATSPTAACVGPCQTDMQRCIDIYLDAEPYLNKFSWCREQVLPEYDVSEPDLKEEYASCCHDLYADHTCCHLL